MNHWFRRSKFIYKDNVPLFSMIRSCCSVSFVILTSRNQLEGYLQLMVMGESSNGVQNYRQVRLVVSPLTENIVHDKVAITLY